MNIYFQSNLVSYIKKKTLFAVYIIRKYIKDIHIIMLKKMLKNKNVTLKNVMNI